jgi:hypothetical protein
MSQGGDFDENQNCTIITISNFSGETDVIEGLYKLGKLGFCCFFAYEKLATGRN